MEQTPALGLLTTDRELIVRSWNAWMAAATGLDAAAAQGRPLLELIPSDRRDLYRDILAEVLDTGTSRVLAPAFHHYLFPCAPPAASPHFEHMQQRVTVAPLRAGADVAGVMVTIEDMTAALDEQRTLAARLNEGNGQTRRDALLVIGADDWRIRGAAVQTLRQSASRDDIANLLASLEQDHGNLAVLSSALTVLTAAHRDVVPPLMALLSDPHPNLRMHAALALGQVGREEAVPALVRALDDEDANVRFHAIEALGRLAAPAAVEPLTRIAESGDFFLSFPAIDALAKTDDPRVPQNLLSLLRNDLLRPAIVDTLGAIGDEECIPPLVDLLNAGNGDVAPAVGAIAQIQERYERTFSAGDQIVQIARQAITTEGLRHLADAIERREMPLAPLVVVAGWMGTRAMGVLVQLIGDPAVGTAAADGLLAMGRTAVAPLMESVTDGERPARLAAATILGRLGDRRAVPALTALLSEADADLVTTAAAALAALGDPRALDSLLSLFGHERAAVRQAAVAAVNAIGAGTAASAIRDHLADPDARVRECAIRVAGYFGFDGCVPAIFKSLEDADETVRRAAIEQLPVIDQPSVSSRLAVALAGETARNRAAAAHAARSIDDPALGAPLIAALTDAEPWVRYFAAGSLAERGDSGSVPALMDVAATDPATQVRIAAVRAVGALDPDAALPLAERLFSDPDEDVACAALSAIANGQSLEVDRFLERGIRSTRLAIRRCAIEASRARRTTAAVANLAWASRLTEPPELATAATNALGTIAAADRGEPARAAAAALLDIGVEADRRMAVVEALARLTGAAIDLVVNGLDDDRVSVRVTTVESLARMRHPRASAALASALRDADPAVRIAAISGFGRLGTPAAAQDLSAIRNEDPDATVRGKAAIVCERYGWGRGQ